MTQTVYCVHLKVCVCVCVCLEREIERAHCVNVGCSVTVLYK